MRPRFIEYRCDQKTRQNFGSLNCLALVRNKCKDLRYLYGAVDFIETISHHKHVVRYELIY
jgi:hypothetical protein